ncbi:hypothetical protein AB0N38_11990 [Micromonospora aurantiaca]|uniref:hypothetical protein n=1 Tax=Micromonospora TaxID=1873 RepID=UPI0001C45867|nr:hypothetical protein [Micromonospora sp. L5]ADU05776.1 hypothetical protein ML5_0223 [Micromonospora sp. L5]
MKLRAAILLALTALSLGLVVVASPAEPAWACSCARTGADERADLIVVGTITEVTDTGVQLAVESVEKGSLRAGATLRLRVGRQEESCGYDFRTGTRYRVNSRDGVTGLCAGITAAPAQVPTTPSAPAAAPTLVTALPAPAQVPGRLWLVGGAVLTVLAAGLVAVSMRRRRIEAKR